MTEQIRKTKYPRTFAKATFIGRVGSTNFKTITNGSLLEISLAIDESFVKDDVQTLITNWYKMVIYGKRAESLNTFLAKGHNVYVEAVVRKRKWLDQEQNNRSSIEFVVRELIVLPSNRSLGQDNLTDKNEENIDLDSILNEKNQNSKDESQDAETLPHFF